MVPVATTAITLTAVAYAALVRRRPRTAGAWPAGRSVAFLGGLALLAVAAVSPLAAAEDRSFPAHVGQHLLLGMAGPLLLALGAPVTLVLQASPPRLRRFVRRALHHPVVRAVGHPVVGWAAFSLSLWVL